MTASTRSRGLVAALLLAASTVGLPLALAATAGDPLHSWPSLRSGQLSDTDMIAVLTAVFWLAWLSFVLPVAVEAVVAAAARISHRPPRPIRLPLLSAQQHLARQLISAVLLLLPATTSALSATALPAARPVAHITATAWSTTEPSASHGQPGSGHREPDGQLPAYRIPDDGGMRSYWALAEHYLGDGTRWREIWWLNEGRVHSDGTVMDSPRQLHSGWTILLPAGTNPTGTTDPPAATHDVRVAPGDTLSGLAAADGVLDWHQAWQINADRPEPDGQRYADPNLIRPGWTLRLPGAPGRGPDPAAPSTHDPGGASGASGYRPQWRPPTAIGAPGVSPSTRPSNEGAATPITSSQRQPATADAHGDGEHRSFPIVPLEVGLAAAAGVAALDRARRIAQRRRRVGHRPVPPPAPLRQVEAELRRAARITHPAVAAVELATALTTTSSTAVQVTLVIARDDGAVDLHLSPGSRDVLAPPPFVTIPAGWRLPADATKFAFAVDSVDEAAPTLTPVGRITDGDVLVNLAYRGLVSVAGDPDTTVRFLHGIAQALLAAPWAGRVCLHVPTGLADRIGDHERSVADDHAPVLPSPLPRASDGIEEPGWCTTPIYLYLGWFATDPIEELLAAAGDPTTTVYAVLNGAREATTLWTLDDDRLTLPGVEEPVIVTLPGVDKPAAADLIGFTRTAPDVPVGDPLLPDHVADAPPHLTPTSRQLNLLGRVELAGVTTPRRTQILNLLTYLALHRRGVDHDTLTTVLWKEAVSGKTLRNRMTEARQLVGGAITEGPNWRLTDEVTTDWQRFTALAVGSSDEQHEALRLVRGRPFEGLDYADWLDLDGVRSDVEASIVDLALTVAQRDLAAGDPDAAYKAARAGLAASRYDERLHRLAIRAAEAAGHNGVVQTLKAEMRAAIDTDIEPDDALQPETLALYAELRRPRVTTGEPR